MIYVEETQEYTQCVPSTNEEVKVDDQNTSC